jgi:hypothetical protein
MTNPSFSESESEREWELESVSASEWVQVSLLVPALVSASVLLRAKESDAKWAISVGPEAKPGLASVLEWASDSARSPFAAGSSGKGRAGVFALSADRFPGRDSVSS